MFFKFRENSLNGFHESQETKKKKQGDGKKEQRVARSYFKFEKKIVKKKKK